MQGKKEDTVCYSLSGIEIDAERLLHDYEAVASDVWTSQNRYAKGMTNWKGISLYSINGASDDLRCADKPIVSKTPAGDVCSYICDELLPQFGARPLRVAFYRLTAGTNVGKHKDYGQNRTAGMVRIHIPVITNKDVTMQVEDNTYHFGVGEAWYFDASCWHSVKNSGADDRIHLIADFYPSPELDAHLKPISFNDRLRFLMARMEFNVEIAKTFAKFIVTREGRARIMAKLGVAAKSVDQPAT